MFRGIRLKWKKVNYIMADLKKKTSHHLGVLYAENIVIEKLQHVHIKIATGKWNQMSNHLAIMRNPWMKLLIEGTKTIESRISQKRIAPWRKVEKWDWIYFRLSGKKMVTHKAQVQRVMYYEKTIFEIMRLYHKEIGIDNAYVQSKHKCKYLTLIWLRPIVALGNKAFPFVKKDQRAWICNINGEN